MNKFKKDDYVKVLTAYTYPIGYFLKENLGQINDVINRYRLPELKTKEIVYRVMFTNIPEYISPATKNKLTCVEEDLILATTEEIEEWKLKNDMTKYNL